MSFLSKNKDYVVCVHYGNKYPVEYVNKLNKMVKRYSDSELICITDTAYGKDPDIHIYMGNKDMGGWWNKLQLFKPDFLKGQKFLYLDLDVVIVDDIRPIINYDSSFATIDDWIFDTYNSSVMLMCGGKFPWVWDLYVMNEEAAQKASPEGDQQWISNYVEADLFPEDWITSYRMSDCEKEPKGKIVVFHGKPNPHEIKGTWVEKYWA